MVASNDAPTAEPPAEAPSQSPPLPEAAPAVPEVVPLTAEPDERMQRIEELVRRTQRAVVEALEGVLARQVVTLLERAERTALATGEEVFSKHAELLMARLKGALLETAEGLQQRHLGPFLESLKQTTLAALEEIGQKQLTPALAHLQATLGETVREALRRQVDQVVDRTRLEMREGAAFVQENADLLVAKMQAAVTEPITRAVRAQLPDYAHWAGGRVLDYALAATLFCMAAVLLLMGAVQGLQAAGVPAYLTYLLGGLTALGTGLVFLRLFRRPQTTTANPAAAQRKDERSG